MRTIILLILSGCVSLATYQTPYTIKKDELSWGLSTSGYVYYSNNRVGGVDGIPIKVTYNNIEVGGIPISIPAFYFRHGLSDNVDLGFSFVGFPFFGSTYLDLKNQFIRRENFVGSSSVGMGFWFWFSETDNIRNFTFLQPFFVLSFGNERIYAGTKIQLFLLNWEQKSIYGQGYGQYKWIRQSSIAFTPSIFLGFTIGKHSLKPASEFDLMLPLSATDTRGEVVPLSGIIFSYTFGFLYIP
jgi:hypothetical protein